MTTIAEIQKAVAEHFRISVIDILSDRQGGDVARPRHIAMYLAKGLTRKSYPEIGRLFKRDHTIVMRAAKGIHEARKTDEELDAIVGNFVRAFRAKDKALTSPFNWSAAPAPWNTLGPEIAAQLRAIALA